MLFFDVEGLLDYFWKCFPCTLDTQIHSHHAGFQAEKDDDCGAPLHYEVQSGYHKERAWYQVVCVDPVHPGIPFPIEDSPPGWR